MDALLTGVGQMLPHEGNWVERRASDRYAHLGDSGLYDDVCLLVGHDIVLLVVLWGLVCGGRRW